MWSRRSSKRSSTVSTATAWRKRRCLPRFRNSSRPTARKRPPATPRVSRTASARAASRPHRGTDPLPQRLLEAHRLAQGRRGQLPLPHDDVPANDRADRPAGHRDAVIRGPAAFRGDPAIADGLAALEVDDREVAIVAGGDPTLARDAEKPLRPGTGEVDEALEGEASGVDVVEHERNERLHAGHARGRVRIDLVLLLARMRGVVRAEDIGYALRDPAPDAGAVRLIAHGGVHLGIRSEPLVASRSDERQVVRRDLDRGDVLVIPQELHLLRGGDV